MLKRGWDLTYVYVTDGRHGSDTVPPEELVEIRREEARRERTLLGIQDFIELGVEDGSVARLRGAERRALKQRLGSIVAGAKADLIVMPGRSDMHPDHRATHDLVTEALQDRQLRPLVVKYFVWLFPDFYRKRADAAERVLMVGVDGEMTRKMSAIRLHRSQVSRGSFDAMARTLNAYLAHAFRAQAAMGARYVEIIGLNGAEGHARVSRALLRALEPWANVTSVFHGRPSQGIGAQLQ
jgi:LmbE family N-acetylglucosaminyl deacetylase